jgi:hypothetical protein
MYKLYGLCASVGALLGFLITNYYSDKNKSQTRYNLECSLSNLTPPQTPRQNLVEILKKMEFPITCHQTTMIQNGHFYIQNGVLHLTAYINTSALQELKNQEENVRRVEQQICMQSEEKNVNQNESNSATCVLDTTEENQISTSNDLSNPILLLSRQ